MRTLASSQGQSVGRFDMVQQVAPPAPPGVPPVAISPSNLGNSMAIANAVSTGNGSSTANAMNNGGGGVMESLTEFLNQESTTAEMTQHNQTSAHVRVLVWCRLICCSLIM